MWKIFLILAMGIVAGMAIVLMKKIAPEDRLYPVWALIVVVLFSIFIMSR